MRLEIKRNDSNEIIHFDEFPKFVIITFGRYGYWYEQAKGKRFKVISACIKPGHSIPELVVELDGFLGDKIKTGLLQSESDYRFVWN